MAIVIVQHLHKIRDTFLWAARRNERNRAALTEQADWADEAAERFIQLEIEMRTTNEAIRALIDDDKANRATIASLSTENGDLKAQLATAQADAVSPENLAAVNELVPEVPPVV